MLVEQAPTAKTHFIVVGNNSWGRCMSPGMEEQINKLKSTIAELEAQRAILGNEFVDSTLSTLQEKLIDLEAQAEQLTVETHSAPTRQRKLVTLLYLDVVGSTAMTQHLDPEDTLEIMDNALPRLAAPIEAHGGHVTRYTGDGFKAVFGDPLAREDDPEQAIRAGLEILGLSRVIALELEQEWDIGNFQVRIGIDTGLAALGGQTEAEDTVMGRVVNLAVRIESAAPPGGLLISHTCVMQHQSKWNFYIFDFRPHMSRKFLGKQPIRICNFAPHPRQLRHDHLPVRCFDCVD